MTLGPILLPLLLALLLHWLPRLPQGRRLRHAALARWLPPGGAAVTLVLACSLPWTGGTLGGWLLPEPLAVHVVLLCCLAWLVASLAASLVASGEGPDVAPQHAAPVVGCINLALLADDAGLSVVAAGAAVLAGILALRRPDPQPLLVAAACALGLAVFGLSTVLRGTLPALGGGWASSSWSALPDAAARSSGPALSLGFAASLLGLGCACLLLPLWSALRGLALPRTLAVLAGPLGGVWLVVALRLRGLLDGNAHAVVPGIPLLAVGLFGCALAPLCLAGRDPARLLPATIIGTVAAAAVGIGLGGATATAAGLLHLTLGCLALTAAVTGGWPAVLGVASLAVLPPFALFGSGLALLAAAADRQVLLVAPLALLLLATASLALRLLPAATASPAAPVGWAGLALALLGAWALPGPAAAWLHGIAAAAR